MDALRPKTVKCSFCVRGGRREMTHDDMRIDAMLGTRMLACLKESMVPSFLRSDHIFLYAGWTRPPERRAAGVCRSCSSCSLTAA